MGPKSVTSIDEYIAGFSPEVQRLLEQVRLTIKAAAPQAQETISYAIPTFSLNGHLVHFAAFKNHIGFYPVPSGVEAFKDELAAFKCGKGSAQFPFNRPLPLDLISRIVEFRVVENLQKAAGKSIKGGRDTE